MRRALLRWGAGIVLVIGALEAGLRYGVGLGDPPLVTLNPVTEYELVPGQRYERFGNTIEINSVGLRGPEIPAIQTIDERRVLLIGDSVIYGNHFLDQSETIGLRLSTKLQNSAMFSGCKITVMPAAVSSWGPVNQAAFLNRTGLLDADFGAILVSSHDLFDTPDFGSVVPYQTTAPLGALGDAASIVRDRMIQRTTQTVPLEDRREASLTALGQVAEQFAQANVPLVLVYHPTITERQREAHNAKALFRQWADDNNVEWYDLRVIDMGKDEYRDDIHPNPNGADRISAVFADLAGSRLTGCQ